MNLITIIDLSTILKVKQSTIYSWVHNGSIPFHKLNGLVRFDVDEIDAWIKESKKIPPSNAAILRKSPATNIEKIVKKAIDGTKGKEYNSSNGKPGQMQGLRKEA
jgi:excisionase family DNA binding protein